MKNHCFDYNPPHENEIAGHRVILYPCHGLGQNQVRFYFHCHSVQLLWKLSLSIAHSCWSLCEFFFLLFLCFLLGKLQFFEYTSHKEIRYNTRHPEVCAGVDLGTDYLKMYLCQSNSQNIPENQKFDLREVRRQLSTVFLLLYSVQLLAVWMAVVKAPRDASRHWICLLGSSFAWLATSQEESLGAQDPLFPPCFPLHWLNLL